MINLVAFAGYARVGKDVASSALESIGHKRVAFGSIIKHQVNEWVWRHLGFSAFTEVDSEKKLIRPLLECWGDVFYKQIMDEFFHDLPERAVNARIVRSKEAIEWIKRGGVIIEIHRPGFGPATDWERDRLEELRAAGVITHTISASCSEDLKRQVVDYVTSPRALPLAA